ncbi:hypothetical protein [Flavobacterium sp. LC2016-12]|uniref:hypothetical protein n=1 Tax=Flavobacterium sp. LC2016-12 TaxID=2783794 RepID=UPI00188D4F58|nr:hypothetical protein [Flavobacterium sp. LC2016-12]MBF4465212.1 hypothetical protein [Flavobacterium sp. LC2016-12]
MKKLDKKINKTTSKIKSTVSIDKKLDKIKSVNFVSNKIDEANMLVNNLELTH